MNIAEKFFLLLSKKQKKYLVVLIFLLTFTTFFELVGLGTLIIFLNSLFVETTQDNFFLNDILNKLSINES